MGNSSSSGRSHHDESVDYGSLVPQGVYTGPRDWNQAIVSQLIVARKLAPFYRPLEDYDDSWDDDQILAARKELPDPENADVVTRIEATATASSSHKSRRPGSLKEPAKPEAQVYRGAVECPICFLYYPPNINHSRCCDQAICTECFVQIKRAEPTTTHLVSEPAACPYCVQENFGVVYTPPPWRAGLGSEGYSGFPSTDSHRGSSEPATPPTHKRRQKSFSADSPEVVTTDQIRPDWEAKLEAVRAAVQRRANRRIIMRQVGDRLIPVGVTSGRVHALSPEEAAAAGANPDGSGSRRSRRRPPQNTSFEQFVGMAGQDLEELMLMEAMRLSLLDHEEHQRKEAEEKKKQEAAAAAAAASGEGSSAAGPSTEGGSSETAQNLGSSALEAQSSSSLQASSSSNLSLSPSATSNSDSPAPSHANVGSQESLAPRNSCSLSRSRSRTPPPPTNPDPIPNLPLSEENQAAWRNRPSGPPAFSTLNAALTSASTAAALLGSSSSGGQQPSRTAAHEPNPTNVPSSSSLTPEGSVPKADTVVEATSIPTITVEIDGHHATETAAAASSTGNTSSATPSSSTSQGSHDVPGLNGAVEASYFGSTITTPESESEAGASSYMPLPSSPEADDPLSSLTKSMTMKSDSPIEEGPGRAAGAGVSAEPAR
ncbi:hypothetical protein CVT26_003432 [Gymnopilus dilepis]|uniref:RING-type domain-containing protein n=1 Tax=Gymnopilus dilepis TaxID=231916 RepID=A0A409VQH4_9AGAR|nr:hypothetical protein CVT26_003432 [Gymnopilus dilepis]